MDIPAYIKESDRIAMNQAAKAMAWDWYNKGVMLAVESMREGLSDGTAPTRDELIAWCNLLENKTREPLCPSPLDPPRTEGE